MPPIMSLSHSIVKREAGFAGDQIWWRLRITQGLREVWQMTGVTNAKIARVAARGVAPNDWYWSLKGGLSIVFRYEADALKAAERFDENVTR